jgi:Peptidase_C39 like family
LVFFSRSSRKRRGVGTSPVTRSVSQASRSCSRVPSGSRPTRFSRATFERIVVRDILKLLSESRELHYSKRNTDHFTCYEVRGQETSVWCVAASVQMLLDFYRYEYTQVRLAAELGLGTLANPNGLPYSRDGDVVTVIEAITSNALDAAMNTTPTWSEFRTEILANRPLISFVPGHSRTVAGYTRVGLTGFGFSPFRGLLVYDPWPRTPV